MPAASRGYRVAPGQLRGGGGRGAAVTGLAIAAVLGLLIWQPWTPPSDVALAPEAPSPTPARAADLLAPATGPEATGVPAKAQIPGVITSGLAFYTSITDNEWTVVALLAQAAPTSTEEPATQHGDGAPWSQAGPLLVLQQGLAAVDSPIERAGDPAAPCVPRGVPRDRIAVPLPAGRVAYLGVTIPRNVPRPEVTATLLGGPPGTLLRVTSPAVELAGVSTGGRVVIPSSGPGGAILFAPETAGLVPPGAYRFEVASPGAMGDRYLYACVAP